MRALQFCRFGGPEVLALGEQPVPELVPGTALVRTHAIGLNYADVYRRQGNYHLEGEPPWVLGYEAAGVIEALVPPAAKAGAHAFSVGDRVAFADVPHANAELVRAPLDRLVPVPDALGLDTAAAVLLQGLTAQYLIDDSRALKAGETVLVHAAAGGVGLLLVQLATLRGARVMALSSSDAKLAAARAAGAIETARYDGDWVAAAQAFGGGGVDVVYDSVGTTLWDSLAAARIGGQVVFYGMAGGEPPLIDPRRLMDQSKTVTGGDLWNILTSHEARLMRSRALFADVCNGHLTVHIAARVPLADGASAHQLLESRRTSGKVLLIP